MNAFRKIAWYATAVLAACATPLLASAHEVYVLTQNEIQQDITAPRFDWISVILADFHQFTFWAFLSILVVLLVFGISIIRPLERWLDPQFDRLKKYALHITRITVGIAFLAGAWYAAAYGPELPLAATWGSYTLFIQALLALIGICLVCGVFVRTAGLVALVLFVVNVCLRGTYMLTYTNYLGEILVLILLGAESFRRTPSTSSFMHRIERIGHRAKPYAFLIIRVCFGVSLLYASIYAKFIHDHLALDVATGTGILPSVTTHAYSVAQALGFEPHFLVVGAGIVEIVIALFFILGIEIRFTAIFLEVWLALSLWYFGEAVWPHLILIGIPIAFIIYGYDKYSIEGWLFKKGRREPVL